MIGVVSVPVQSFVYIVKRKVDRRSMTDETESVCMLWNLD